MAFHVPVESHCFKSTCPDFCIIVHTHSPLKVDD
jgi:hypothetical protein